MLQLRDYQEQCIADVAAALRDRDYSLFCLFMGLGKTETAFGIIKRILAARPSARICFIVNRLTLLKQTFDRAVTALPGVTIGQYHGAKKDRFCQVTIGSIRSMADMGSEFDFILLDEAHNINQEQGDYSRFVDGKKPGAKVIAFTATPYRASSPIYGKDSWFPIIDYNMDYAAALEKGWLVPMRYGGSPEAFDTSALRVRMGDWDKGMLEELVDDPDKLKAQVQDAIPRLLGRKKILWNTVSIRHATAVAAALRLCGEDAEAYHSGLDVMTKGLALKSFTGGGVRHLINVASLNEGFNFPPIDAVVLLRPTRSATLYVQTCGRGLRRHDDKKNCLLLDYGLVVEFLGPIDKIKLKSKKSARDDEPVLVICHKCFAYNEPGLKVCEECGAVLRPKKPRSETKRLTREAGSDGVLSGEFSSCTIVSFREDFRGWYLGFVFKKHDGGASPVFRYLVYSAKNQNKRPYRFALPILKPLFGSDVALSFWSRGGKTTLRITCAGQDLSTDFSLQAQDVTTILKSFTVSYRRGVYGWEIKRIRCREADPLLS